MNRADITSLLELVQQYDQREITADLIHAWHQQLGHLPYPVAEEAVHIHHKTSSFAITPSDVATIAADIATRTTSAPAPKRRARMNTYTVTGAINDTCPDCNAEPGETCTRDGEETAMPCISRLVGRKVHAAPQQGHRRRVA